MTGTDTHPNPGTPTSEREDRDQSWWATTWPLERFDWVRLLVALAGVVTVGVVVGEILTGWSALDGLIDADRRIAEDLAAGRTEAKNDLAHWSAFIADTPVKIAASLIIAGFLLWRYRRWREAVMVGLPLIFEATAFIITTYIVKRPRPDVDRLLESPVDTSFPSGHVAAATVYVALAFIVLWHTRKTWVRVAAVVFVGVAPVAVAWARMYQGMHYLTDVIGGMLLGIVSVVICRRILGAPRDAEDVVFDDRDEAPVEPAA